MSKIQIVIAPPGPTTTERIGELIQNHPEGTTVRELSRQLNRPVSMVQHCLKSFNAELLLQVQPLS